MLLLSCRSIISHRTTSFVKFILHVCTKSFLKTTTNSSCVCTHLANKADSDSDSDIEHNVELCTVKTNKSISFKGSNLDRLKDKRQDRIDINIFIK